MIKHLFKPMADADRFIGLFLWLNYPDITADNQTLKCSDTCTHLTMKHYTIV